MPQKSIHTRQTQSELAKVEPAPTHLFKVLFGIIFFYGVVVYGGLSLLYKVASFSLFMVILANVDMVAEILAYSIPSIFSQIYDPDTKTILSFFSFNLVCIIAISGVLLNGLIMLSHGTHKIHEVYFAMVVSYLVTFLIPTNLIPEAQNYAEHFVKNTLGFSKTTLEGVDLPKLIGGFITMALFIFSEDLIIENFVMESKYTFNIPVLSGLIDNVKYLLKKH